MIAKAFVDFFNRKLTQNLKNKNQTKIYIYPNFKSIKDLTLFLKYVTVVCTLCTHWHFHRHVSSTQVLIARAVHITKNPQRPHCGRRG